MRIIILIFSLLLISCQAEEITAGDGFMVEAVIPVGANPHGMQKEGERLYIAAAGDDRIEVLDLKTRKIVERWDAPDTPLDLVKSLGGWLVSAFSSDYLHILDNAGRPTTMAWRVGAGPSLFAPDRGGDLAYIVSELNDTFTVFDRAMGEEVKTYPTGKRPYPADVTHDGVLAFIPNRDEDTVSVIDLLNGEEVTRVPVCDGPLGGSLTIDEVSYIVSCGGNDRVQFINTASLEVVAEVADGIGPRPFSVAVSPDRRYAFVNNSRAATVSVIDLESLSVIENIEVGETPIVMRIFGHTLYVASEGSDTVSIIPLPARITVMGGPPNQVVVLGMIHDGHETSERYSLEVLRDVIRRIGPDIVITEIPPNRLEAAIRGFEETGRVSEPRVSVFPEYTEVLFPLTEEMDFEIIGAAAWNSYMNRYRSRALEGIENDPARAGQWAENRAAKREMSDVIGGRWDDPAFIHSAEYDLLQQNGWRPYDVYFNDELGPGGWSNINQGHYALIAGALQRNIFKGKRVLIMFGASHKYWLMEKLRERDDIDLLDAAEFFRD